MRGRKGGQVQREITVQLPSPSRHTSRRGTDQLLSLDLSANYLGVLRYPWLGVGLSAASPGQGRRTADMNRSSLSLRALDHPTVVFCERTYKQPSLFTVHLTSPCARALRSSARARDRRDMTVPMAVPVICAISAYDRPSISRSTRMSR